MKSQDMQKRDDRGRQTQMVPTGNSERWEGRTKFQIVLLSNGSVGSFVWSYMDLNHVGGSADKPAKQDLTVGDFMFKLVVYG